MQRFIINNFFLNELASRGLGGKNRGLKALFVTLFLLLSVLFYGLESLAGAVFRRT